MSNFTWDQDESHLIVLENWSRNGSNYDLSDRDFQELGIKVPGTMKIFEGFCVKCESPSTVVFKKEAHKFDVEVYRVCGKCHHIYSYRTDVSEGGGTDVRLFEYDGNTLTEEKIFKSSLIVTSKIKEMTSFGLSVDPSTEDSKLELLSSKMETGIKTLVVLFNSNQETLHVELARELKVCLGSTEGSLAPNLGSYKCSQGVFKGSSMVFENGRYYLSQTSPRLVGPVGNGVGLRLGEDIVIFTLTPYELMVADFIGGIFSEWAHNYKFPKALKVHFCIEILKGLELAQTRPDIRFTENTLTWVAEEITDTITYNPSQAKLGISSLIQDTINKYCRKSKGESK